jgi:hypothetical protein
MGSHDTPPPGCRPPPPQRRPLTPATDFPPRATCCFPGPALGQRSSETSTIPRSVLPDDVRPRPSRWCRARQSRHCQIAIGLRFTEWPRKGSCCVNFVPLFASVDSPGRRPVARQAIHAARRLPSEWIELRVALKADSTWMPFCPPCSACGSLSLPSLRPTVINHRALGFPIKKKHASREILFGPVLTAQSDL